MSVTRCGHDADQSDSGITPGTRAGLGAGHSHPHGLLVMPDASCGPWMPERWRAAMDRGRLAVRLHLDRNGHALATVKPGVSARARHLEQVRHCDWQTVTSSSRMATVAEPPASSQIHSANMSLSAAAGVRAQDRWGSRMRRWIRVATLLADRTTTDQHLRSDCRSRPNGSSSRPS